MIAEADEMIHAANQAGLEVFEREADYVRTGYLGGRAGGRETGEFRGGQPATTSENKT
jgi:hypothetical protein